MFPTDRTDEFTAAIVDTGVRISETAGTLFGWAYLARHGIPEAAIVRILSQRRRPLADHQNNVSISDNARLQKR